MIHMCHFRNNNHLSFIKINNNVISFSNRNHIWAIQEMIAKMINLLNLLKESANLMIKEIKAKNNNNTLLNKITIIVFRKIRIEIIFTKKMLHYFKKKMIYHHFLIWHRLNSNQIKRGKIMIQLHTDNNWEFNRIISKQILEVNTRILN